MRGFGRTIALREFNAVQTSNGVLDTGLFASIRAVTITLMCISQLSCQIVLPFRLPAKRGLVQIADALTEEPVVPRFRLVRSKNCGEPKAVEMPA